MEIECDSVSPGQLPGTAFFRIKETGPLPLLHRSGLSEVPGRRQPPAIAELG